MATLKATVIDPVGFHARPATLAVTEAGKFKSDIKLLADGKEGDMKSIMAIMAMGVKKDAQIEVIAEGEDADAAVAAIETILKDNKII